MRARLALLLALSASPALAASPGYEQCVAAIDPAGFTNSQLLECATKDMDRADTALNDTYRATMTRLPPARQATLREDERNWIKTRQSRCALEHQPADPLRDVNRMLCLVRETDGRTGALRATR